MSPSKRKQSFSKHQAGWNTSESFLFQTNLVSILLFPLFPRFFSHLSVSWLAGELEEQAALARAANLPLCLVTL